MPQNPFTDIWKFLTGNTNDYLALGGWRFLLVGLFYALIVLSVVIAIRNWRDDPAQRTGTALGMWLSRVLVGCMWFEGMLWKLPLPVGGGLRYWTEQMGTRAAFEFHRVFVTDFLLPNLYLFGPLVFLAELMFSTSLILGLGVRFAGIVAIFFVLHLWLGIYLPGAPAEWSWSYIFLALLMFLFALHAAGRSLGLDAWLRRHVPAVRDGKGVIGWVLRVAG
ncbi:MAG TPA: DoxX family protein [Xanthobacteraceae bacterium]|nr:DoxX family protein [Xanthobacteraceae bacterium]